MNRLFALVLTTSLLLFNSIISAQAPEGFKAGYIVTGDNTRIEGYVKEKFKSKTAIQFQSADGKKLTYNGSDIKETGFDNTIYATYKDDFFKVISSGAKATLYQKVSDASGKVIYNGSQAIGISAGTDGAINDYFIKTGTNTELKLVTKKNFEAVVTASCADCPGLLENIKTSKLGYADIAKAIEQYNSCQ